MCINCAVYIKVIVNKYCSCCNLEFYMFKLKYYTLYLKIEIQNVNILYNLHVCLIYI